MAVGFADLSCKIEVAEVQGEIKPVGKKLMHPCHAPLSSFQIPPGVIARSLQSQ